MTARIVLLVEGQTEEAFVNRVLQPYMGSIAYLTPIVVHTSRAADGSAYRGGGGWKHYHHQLENLLSQPHWAIVTTLIDYYGYPSDAPQCSCSGLHIQPECVEARERSIKESFTFDSRFVPFLALHEFETLVIAAGATSPDVLGNSATAQTFRTLVDENLGNAERINNGPTTAPSKRVAGAIDGYSKVRDGVAILENRLEPALAVTPRFHAWVSGLQSAISALDVRESTDDADDVTIIAQ